MNQRIEWYRTPIGKETLARLTRRSDARGLLQSGSFLLVYLATASLALFFFMNEMWVPMIAACYLHSVFHGFIGMEAAVHELSHGTPFKTKWLNELFYRIFSFLSWNNWLHFRESHMMHHQYTVHRGLDREVVIEPISFTFLDYLSWFTFDYKKFARIVFTTVAHAFGDGDADFFFWKPLFASDDPKRGRMIAWARFVLIGHLVLLALFIYFELWVLIYVVTFGYFFATFLSHGTGIQQHLGLKPGVPDWRISCHTVLFDPLMSFLYWKMNYHIEHHMYAAVPFYNLPALNAAIAKDTPEPVRGYLAGIRKIIAIGRKQRLDPSYCHIPEFPETAAPPKLD